MSLITPDFGLLFWMTLIFAIVFLVLAKWGFPVITGMVAKRRDRINESLRLAAETERKAAEMQSAHERMLEEVRREQAAMLKEASAQRDAIVAQAREQARDEARKVMDSARESMAAEKEAALRDIRAQVAAVSVGVAEKIVRERLSDDKAQSELINRFVDEAASARQGQS